MSTPDTARKIRILLGTAFTGAGIAHVVKHDWFEQLVPEPLSQWRKPISAITAVIQLVGGISMFIPRLRTVACWTNLAMLVPTLPAAVAQTRHPDLCRLANPLQRYPARLHRDQNDREDAVQSADETDGR